MTGWPAALDRFLQTDPRDVGCAQAMNLLHVYVELVAADRTGAERYPGIAAHLRACGPCGEDFDGLLAAVTGTAELSGPPGQGRKLIIPDTVVARTALRRGARDDCRNVPPPGVGSHLPAQVRAGN
ncbi:MAG TPA: hypothetical protein VGM79_07650 [Streptosporangiaceae bacterium]|jgi:hypothetical protein